MSFEDALARTLGFEGGLEANAADTGGRTNYGVTQKTYDSWRIAQGLTARPVDFIEDTEVSAIYREGYWVPCGCDLLPERLAALVFDAAVNHGAWNAKLALQRAASVRADGVIGPATLLAVRAIPDIGLRFLKQRAELYKEIVSLRPSQVTFLGGWISRLLEQAWRPS